ncbi:hypothetical protein NG798_26785 [Ancylothrix sp. C2]|uniref:hypothetical protein n=1 Tax=Ancylothrix sp. D3o TaxID=2953691 RepID=UPI0021BA83AF|nr:hypothetical protein [Ancylothrix sp. D3o]MCT7953410.1 hypothetical protein [Ancylothrix sp. D3o]
MTRYVFTYNVLALLPEAGYESRLFKIKSKTSMLVWNGNQKKWMHQSQPDSSSTVRLNEVTYKNIMLSKLHPDQEFSVCAIPTDSNEKSESLLDDYENFSLDLAGGARKHGHFVFSRKQSAKGTVGQFYFPPEKESMGRINYGSISLSECKALFVLKKAKILVLKDPDLQNNRPKPGSENPWEIGDAHGKISDALLNSLLADITSRPKTPTQFRLGIAGNETRKGIWGKGTVLPLPASEMQGYDMVLPESCFKTFKPPFGDNVFEDVCLAALGEAQERKSKGGTQIWSWFPVDIIEQDVMPATRQKCEELIQKLATKNIYQIVGTFQPSLQTNTGETPAKTSPEINELPPLANKWFDDLALLWDSGNPQDDTDDDAEPYMSTLAMILADDQARILEKHPYVIDSILRSLKKKWTRLAINGAFRAASFMAMPDDSLADLSFSCKHLKPGRHITFRYPVRHWGDIQIWENVVDGNGYNGVFFVSHVTFGGTGELNESPFGQGGDFDGDYGNAAKAEKLPNITQRIWDWNDPTSPHYRRQPKLVKAPKSPIQDTLKRVALRSMDNLTGLVASQIMWAQAKGLTEEIIPDGSGRTVLEVLSQALQDEVDRFKNDLQRDTRALEMVSSILNRGAARPQWLTELVFCDSFHYCQTNKETNNKRVVMRTIRAKKFPKNSPPSVMPKEKEKKPLKYKLK